MGVCMCVCTLVALCTTVSISTVKQSESAIPINKSALFWISSPFSSPQSTESSSLLYTVVSH